MAELTGDAPALPLLPRALEWVGSASHHAAERWPAEDVVARLVARLGASAAWGHS